jgi:outer membrane lipoprotein-sorting protein
MTKTHAKFLSVAMFCAITVTGAYAQAAAPAASSMPTAATKPAAALPSADQVIDNYVKAIGGRDAWLKIKSRVSIGTIDVPAYNISGTVEVHQKAPDKLLSQAVVGGQAYRHGSDGDVSWSDDPQNGVKVETGAAAASSKREADFYHPLDLKKIYAKLNVTGTEKVNGHDAYVLEATTAEGVTDKMYFDTTGGLMVRSVSHHPTPDGNDAVYTADIEDYRDVDGIKIPFLARQSSDQAAYTITFTDVKNNVDLTDDQFAKPKPE